MASILDLVTFSPKRAIESFSNYVAIEEQHTDTLTITRHPVEQGAAIADHAYKEPAQLTIRAGWTNSSLQALIGGALEAFSGDLSGLLQPDYVGQVYDQLLTLQADREPFDVYTGKRHYEDMLIKSLAVTTDQETENVLIVTATFEQVIIVSSQVTTLPSSDVQANQAKTAAPQDLGTRQAIPAAPALGLL